MARLRVRDGGTDLEGDMASVAGSLVASGLAHLDEAVGTPGRDREAAFQLLAADALITYGCEAASEAADVRSVLMEVLIRASAGGGIE
jgi:hypothetical protein